MADTPVSSRLIDALEPYEAELNRVVDFWLSRCLDERHGGYLTQISRRGRVFGEDKNVWVQGRQCWTFAALYNHVEPRDDWLHAARLGRDFLVNHAHAGHGRWRYLLSRTGEPLDATPSLVTDCNAMMALAEYAVASGREDDHALIAETYDQFERRFGPPAVDQWHHFSFDPDRLWLAPFMVVAGMAPVLRPVLSGDRVNPLADQAVHTITRNFARDAEQRVFEVLHLDGLPLDTPIGRRLNPGHALEACWFCIEEAMQSDDRDTMSRCAEMCRWTFDLGYDEEHGGIFAFVDRDGGRPIGSEYVTPWGDRWDDKLWWPQSESLYALALAASLTGEADLCDRFDRLSGFVLEHQIDREHGEWYESLHRHGEPRSPLKGSWIKCMFHVTRNLYKMALLGRRLAGG